MTTETFTLSVKDRSRAGFKSFRSGMKGVTRSLTSFKGLALSVAGIGGLGALSKSFINASQTAEDFSVRLSVLLGSAKEGNRVFDDMAMFASKVPFEYEQIMAAATQLSGILEGGADEIKQVMPLIGDLAAASGLSIQKTTEQVTRMFSAGAASADLFRERGILAMLGFQAGVSVSAEETKKRVIAAWEDQESKFRGATDKMASTWTGLTSMMSDKWFAFRKKFMDAGTFDVMKELLKRVDKAFGDFLDGSGTKFKDWTNNIVTGIGFIGDAFRMLKLGFLTLELVFSGVATAILKLLFDIANGYRQLANLIPGIDIGPMEGFENLLDSVADRTVRLKDDLVKLATQPLPSEEFRNFTDEVIAAAEKTREELGKQQGFSGGPPPEEVEKDDKLAAKFEQLRNTLISEEELELESNLIKQENLQLALDAKIITFEEFANLELTLEQKHQDKLTKIEKKGLTARAKFERLSAKGKTKMVLSEMQTLTQGVATYNKTLFRANQIAGAANATISAFEGAALAIKTYPPPISFVMAGLQLAAGFAQVQAIKSASFGGSSSAPSIGGGSATQTTPAQVAGVPSVTNQQTQQVQPTQVTVNLDGQVLIDAVGEASSDGRLTIDANAVQ